MKIKNCIVRLMKQLLCVITQRLENATLEELKDYRLIVGGIGIHFESIDEDISVEGIIRDFGDENKRINITTCKSNL